MSQWWKISSVWHLQLRTRLQLMWKTFAWDPRDPLSPVWVSTDLDGPAVWVGIQQLRVFMRDRATDKWLPHVSFSPSSLLTVNKTDPMSLLYVFPSLLHNTVLGGWKMPLQLDTGLFYYEPKGSTRVAGKAYFIWHPIQCNVLLNCKPVQLLVNDKASFCNLTPTYIISPEQ